MLTGLDTHEPNQDCVAFFFFKDNDPNTRTFDQALRDIAFEVARMDAKFAKYMASNFDSTEVRSLASIWRNLFANYFLRHGATDSSIYIVLDGIDEADRDSREDFLGLLTDVDSVNSRIRVAMLGRPQMTEDLELAELTLPTIIVNKDNNSKDIVKYIKSCIKKSAFIKRRASDALQDEIIEKLSEGAQGMVIRSYYEPMEDNIKLT